MREKNHQAEHFLNLKLLEFCLCRRQRSISTILWSSTPFARTIDILLHMFVAFQFYESLRVDFFFLCNIHATPTASDESLVLRPVECVRGASLLCYS